MRLPISPYGAKTAATVAVASVAATLAAAAWFGYWALALLLPCLFALYFFRDPERRPATEDPLDLLAPADGKVVAIREGEMPEGGGRATLVDIFLSVFDVHINRAPAAGRVAATRYRKGKFLNALRAAAGELNESNTILLELEGGGRIAVRQIAGVIARRIVCAVAEGDEVARAARIGMIKFGSRTQVFVPAEMAFSPRVKSGDRVKAGETVLGSVGGDS